MWKASEIRWPCIALVAIVVAMGFRPGDSAWYFDMSRDFDIALQFNATPSHPLGISLPFTPAHTALKGTHGIRYGPLPIWIDQLFLAFTRNLVTMSAIRAVAVGGLTALGLLWLTQLLKVSPWLAVVTMFSPWMWYYSRQLWDNSLSLPLGRPALHVIRPISAKQTRVDAVHRGCLRRPVVPGSSDRRAVLDCIDAVHASFSRRAGS